MDPMTFGNMIHPRGTFLILLQISSHICDMNILLGFHAVSFFHEHNICEHTNIFFVKNICHTYHMHIHFLC